MDSDDLGRNNSEKIKVWGDKQSWKCINSSFPGHVPTRVLRASVWVVSAWAKGGWLCQQLGWAVCLGASDQGAPSEWCSMPAPGGTRPAPVWLQWSTGSQHRCEWVCGCSWSLLGRECQSALYVLLRVCAAPTSTVGLWLHWLTWPGTSNWDGWDPGAVTEQTGCLSPSVGGSYTAPVCRCVLTCEHV